MAESCCQPDDVRVATVGSMRTSGHELPPPVPACRRCGAEGKPVGQQLVKSMVAVSLRRVTSDEYFFCRTEDCPVVYYSRDDGSVFAEEDLRETVYQKHPHDPETPICYCFRHKVKDLTLAPAEEADRVMADIRAGISADQCACDIRNPQGSCCLGNVTMVARLGRAAVRQKACGGQHSVMVSDGIRTSGCVPRHPAASTGVPRPQTSAQPASRAYRPLEPLVA